MTQTRPRCESQANIPLNTPRGKEEKGISFGKNLLKGKIMESPQAPPVAKAGSAGSHTQGGVRNQQEVVYSGSMRHFCSETTAFDGSHLCWHSPKSHTCAWVSIVSAGQPPLLLCSHLNIDKYFSVSPTAATSWEKATAGWLW